MSEPTFFHPEPWDHLRQFTDARIALGRAGHSLPTHAHLAFQLAHAQAKDAVYLPLNTEQIAKDIRALGHITLSLQSAAPNRATYLQRPDLGRKLNEASRTQLQQWHASHPPARPYNIVVVVADGLSALGIHENAVELIANVSEQFTSNNSESEWVFAPVVLVEQARVAVGDDVGGLLAAELVVVLIGERPGLSSPNSMGIYMSWAPRVGLNDSQRNCISNVRRGGLSIAQAGSKLVYLLQQARLRKLTGVGLKDLQSEVLENSVQGIESRN